MVLSSTSIIADLVTVIAGEHVKNVSLMGPGIDPHTYKASQGDIHLLEKSDLILYNGLHLEAKLADILKQLSRKKTVLAVTKDIPINQLIMDSSYKNMPDPHVWLDISLWRNALITVSKALCQLLPEKKELFLKNTHQYLAKLDQLHAEIHMRFANIVPEKRILITAHDAFAYFGRAYGLKVMGLQGISTASEAGTKDIQALSKLIIEKKVTCIFVESSVPVRHIKALQQAVKVKGHQVNIGQALYTDALGDSLSGANSYLKMIAKNVTEISTQLSK